MAWALYLNLKKQELGNSKLFNVTHKKRRPLSDLLFILAS
ncbi:hypothetical protein STRINF_00115 [Streptococcus infantarius subsp. infantarius ATCC BAA-102]|uniref:Uncharacterized protein n=1 Tax=Streptococcus infantarius subsp. infantarius ATCC BAA-102 TaxID=471872 RepID=A0ABM9XH79_9STRE|nr:hypothetical protein STRINF_00115 [Streptococcus infantarius subsp. infantarius ATCC BAA-102]